MSNYSNTGRENDNENKIKIGFVLDTLGLGGAGKLTVDLINNIDKNKFKISLIILNTYNEKSLYLSKYIPYWVDTIQVNIYKYSFFKRLSVLKNIFDEFQIIYSCLEYSNFYASIVKLISFRKNIFMCNILGVDGVYINRWCNYSVIDSRFNIKTRIMIKYLQNFLFKFIDQFVVISKNTKSFLINFRKIPSEKIRVVYYGVDYVKLEEELLNCENIDSIKNKYSIPTDSFNIGYIGRLTVGKGLEELIHVAYNLIPKVANVRFIIIGEGDMEELMKEKILQYGLSKNFILTGFVENPLCFYKIFNIFIIPSYSEGIPSSLLEAMYFKNITLSSTAGGIPEVVRDNENGFLFEVGNFVGFENKLLNIYQNSNSLSHIKNRAHETIVRNFNLSVNIKQIENIFQDIVNKL